jgi:5,10-methylenetetrahydromethanopterin reductase
LIEHITACGTPDEVRTKVEEYNRNGCTCPILYPLGDDVKLMIDTFAQA